ncbi:MAG: 3'-5' exonuclease [Patescibacteria group bacterium]
MEVVFSEHADGKYLVMDCEFTGLHAFKHGLTQLAAVVVSEELESKAVFNEYVLPPKDVELVPEAMEISGLDIDFLASKGLVYEKLCSKFIDFISENFKEKPVVIGQFLPADYSFLDKIFTNYLGKDTNLQFFEDILSRNFIDTKSLANILNLKAETNDKLKIFESTSLSKPGGLKDTLNIPLDKYKAHDALEDCLANLELLKKMLNLFELSKNSV